MRCLTPGPVEGCVAAPPSKSMFGRAVAAAVLSLGPCQIVADRLCDDAFAAIEAAKAFGMTVSREGPRISFERKRPPTGGEVPCGESGLSLRMFSAVAALFDAEHRLTSRGSLSRRPVDMVKKPLQALGATCKTNNGLPPIVVNGPIHAGNVTVDGSTSSQFLTGLLMALPFCEGDSTVQVPVLKSKPYALMTVEILRHLGVKIEHNSELTFFRVPGDQKIVPFTYEVEGDWSGASFMLVAGAVGGSMTLTGLKPNSPQSDRAILKALEKAGAQVDIHKNEVSVSADRLEPFEFDATHCPDLFPPLAALAGACEGTSRITGVHRLAAKESDRSAALRSELGSLGCHIQVSGDVMEIVGGTITGGTMKSHGDHRIAMAGAVVACYSKRPVYISGSDCVDKSYPGFFEDLEAIGVNVS